MRLLRCSNFQMSASLLGPSPCLARTCCNADPCNLNPKHLLWPMPSTSQDKEVSLNCYLAFRSTCRASKRFHGTPVRTVTRSETDTQLRPVPAPRESILNTQASKASCLIFRIL
ncbi:hypothetical protein B0J14DRAFT_345342 [Halenospora varia]|nr:hypothetical protein B0J14DRAFT_345342 [Halenospora varia]